MPAQRRSVSGWGSIPRHMRSAISMPAWRSTWLSREEGTRQSSKTATALLILVGKKEQTAKNTRVKARVKAEALREFIVTKDQVMIMGHKIADPDSFGACMGIYRAAVSLEKKAHIIINTVTESVRPLYDEIAESPAYEDDIFLTSDQAMDYFTDNTMIVVVIRTSPR